MVKKTTFGDGNLLWYKDAIIYELHIKAFMDANDDGVGDFQGLLSKLDYLEELGVTTIWLLPFYPSPLKDDGYDIMDYYTINPSYGNVNDFKKFVKAAHQRNLRVITELVLNHTSDQHPWFQRARLAPAGSPERDYYVWSDNPEQFKDARIIFQDYETSNWTYDPVAGQYFWHRFFHHQPDLNYDNPQVQKEVFKILEYWLKMGVDGFRLDAVPYIFEREGTNCENLPETHDFLKKIRSFVDKKYPGTLLLAEANMWPEDSAAYFGDGDECQMNYHFPIMPRMFMAMRMENRYPITDIFDQTPEIPDNCQWGIFLRNHDELTLEMVTDEERDYMYKVYAQNPKAKINLGLRRRLAPLMDNNPKKVELINSLLFSLPGTPVLYYGDEIGMGDNFYLGDRDGVRTPMQWSPDRNAGFSKANPQQLYLPVIQDPEYHFGAVNVETQQNNPSSQLWWMKRMIHMRKQHKAFGRGTMKFIHSENPKVLAYTREYEDEIILVVVNLSRHAQVVNLDLKEYAQYTPVEVFSKNLFPGISGQRDYLLTLSGHSFHWFTLSRESANESVFEPINFVDFQDLLSGDNRKQLEKKILPSYLKRSRWFDEGDRSMRELNIIHHNAITAVKGKYLLLIVEIHYDSGLPDQYQIGLAFSKNQRGSVPDRRPRSIINHANWDGTNGVLFDALYNDDFQIQLLKWLGENKKVKNGSGYLKFTSKTSVKKYVEEQKEIRPRMLTSRDTNTSLLYNHDYYLKLYRKLEKDINSDLEINRYLNKDNGFPYVAKLKGDYQFYEGEDSIVLGLLQSAVDHQSEASTYFAEHLDRFFESVLSSGHLIDDHEAAGNLTSPLNYDSLEDEFFKQHYPSLASEHMSMLGNRTAALHQYLGQPTTLPKFKPEEFSLHYQRSLFSKFQTLVRSTFDNLEKQLLHLPEHLQEDALLLLNRKDEVLEYLKQVYAEKLDMLKIRTHGDFHLHQALFTGHDFVFVDFEGDPKKSYSQRRLKKSPLSDVATMLRSIHLLPFSLIEKNENIKKEEAAKLEKWGLIWYHYNAQFFMDSYLREISSDQFLPQSKKQLQSILGVFLMQKSIESLKWELSDPSYTIASPIKHINYLLDNPDL